MTASDIIRAVRADFELFELSKKIRAGKATFADTSRYSERSAVLIGEKLAEILPDLPDGERAELCRILLEEQFEDINKQLADVQAVLDEAQGLHLAPQKAPFPAERVQKVAQSLADVTVPVETVQRRARAATATVAKSFHDDYMKENAKFRSKAGIRCYLNRQSHGECCEWCQAIVGRYEYGKHPDDIFRRHDNCSCTVTFENGRQRQDVWSKRTWEVPGKDAGAPEPTVFTDENRPEGFQPTVLTPGEKSGIIEATDTFKPITTIEEARSYLGSVFASVEKNVSKLDEQLIIENANQLKRLNERFGILSDKNTGSISGQRSRSIAETYQDLISSNNGLVLSSKYYKSYDTLVTAERAMQDVFHSMPVSDEYLSVATITHEYGHMLENEIIRSRISEEAFSQYEMAMRMGDIYSAKNYLVYEEKIIASDIRDELLEIAKSIDPDFSLPDNLSKYGKRSNFEFFAEVFMNSQCGKQNTLGRAMNIWLERGGY